MAEGSGGCPARPASADPAQLGFSPRPMVRWLNPRQLIDTALKVAVSGIFGAYADKRELQAALTPGSTVDRSKLKEIWVDYVADLGDGFNPTYSVARLLAGETLEFGEGPEAHATKRASILIMGGDQVYPAARREEYSNRLIGPYRAALPWSPEEDHPELFAIPGSHDWYDGLTNFIRIFCQQGWIGGWRTRQRRSYFALKLPHNWWLWGLDIQFDTYIDNPQLSYFSEIAAEQIHKGDQIILCTAKPAWLTSTRDDQGVYSAANLDYFERKIIRPTGAAVSVYLSSGRHHYCRFQNQDGSRQRIAAGGGGAFLHPTHQLPQQVEILEEERPSLYRQKAAYPSPSDSRNLRKKLWLVPFQNLRFAGLLGAVHLVLAVMVGLHIGSTYLWLSLGDFARALLSSPVALLMFAAMLSVQAGAMIGLAHEVRGYRRVLLGMLHTGFQLISVTGVIIASSQLASASGLARPWSLTLFLVLLVVLGGVGGSLGLAAYLWVGNCLGLHSNEAYGPLGIMDFKHFLRIHIDKQGDLTIFPIGVDRVGRHWKVPSEAAPAAPWLEPGDGRGQPHLIEAPVRVASTWKKL